MADNYIGAENQLKELIYNVEISTNPRPLYYFTPYGLLKVSLEYFKNSDVIIVDNKWNMWQRGKKLKKKFGDDK